MKHGKIAQGFKSMNALRAHPIIGARDYYYSYVIYQEELRVTSGSTYFTRLRDCFTVPRIRRANYGATTVMLAQQMCGINSKYMYNLSRNITSSPNILQSSPSTVPLSSQMPTTPMTKLYTHLLVMVPFKLSSPSPHYS
jgi:hypothetical protein